MKSRITDYVAIQIRDYDRAVNFYKDILGFELIRYSAAESHFKKDDRHFFVEKKDAGPLRIFFEFEVDDIKQATEELTAAGCLQTKVYSDKSCMIEDPFGFCFHVYEKVTILPKVA